MADQLTRDPAYDTVDPDDFGSMIQTQRYGRRSPAFDKIIASTHDHFWDPLDPAYIDYNTPFDMENNPIIPFEMVAEMPDVILHQKAERDHATLGAVTGALQRVGRDARDHMA